MGIGLCVSLLVCYGITLLNGCHGYCFRGPLMAEMTVSRRLRYYCMYDHNRQNLRLFPGSNLYLVDGCLECTCTTSGLQCCGFGHAGGVIGVPSDCKVVHDGCQPLVVKSNDENADCYTGQPLNYTKLAILPHPDNMNRSPSKEPLTSLNDREQNRTPGINDRPTAATFSKPFQHFTEGKNYPNNPNGAQQIQDLRRNIPLLPNERQIPPSFSPNPYWQQEFVVPWFLFL